MAMRRKVSNYGSSSKCIVLTKEMRELLGIGDEVFITLKDSKLIIEACKNSNNDKTSDKGA